MNILSARLFAEKFEPVECRFVGLALRRQDIGIGKNKHRDQGGAVKAAVDKEFRVHAIELIKLMASGAKAT